MPAKSYNGDYDQTIFVNNDIGQPYYNQVATTDLIPAIVERTKNAFSVAPDYYTFYQRAYTGRRCSCYLGIETSPSGQCQVCFGTGNTSGYQLYGHQTDVFDVTANSSAVNVVVGYDLKTRPLQFRLAQQATRGWIDFHFTPRGGLNICSLAQIYAEVPRGARVRCAVRLFSESTWTPYSMQAITDRLKVASAKGGMIVRIVLERPSVTAPTPRFSHVRIRYKTLEEDRIRVDVPRVPEVNRTSEFGFFEDVQSRTMAFDATLRSITTEDIVRNSVTNRLYKIVSINPNAPAGILTAWDGEVKLVQHSDRLANLP